MTKPPDYLIPKLVNLFAELGYRFHEVQVTNSCFNEDWVVFAHADKSTLVVERYFYSNTERRLKIKRGRLRHSGYDARLVPEAYPQDFNVETVKEVLGELRIDVAARLRQKRLHALLCDA